MRGEILIVLMGCLEVVKRYYKIRDINPPKLRYGISDMKLLEENPTALFQRAKPTKTDYFFFLLLVLVWPLYGK